MGLASKAELKVNTAAEAAAEPEEHGDCPIADESFIEIQSISTGKKYSFTSEEFDRFRLSIKQAVEFALYQSDK